MPSLEDMVRALVREELALARATPPDEYLSTRAAAELAGVAIETVRRWIADKRLKRHGAGRHLRVRRSELEAMLAAPRRRMARVEIAPEARARRDYR